MPDDDLMFEKNYWGDCTNTFDEDQKHYVYARYMGLSRVHYSFDVSNKRILDIGGGPTSILLKTINLKEGKVCDPLEYPDWIYQRYKVKNIKYSIQRGEDVNEKDWDEVWIYNCLQHTDDVEAIIRNALNAGRLLRLFEWVDIPPHEGHPQMITKDLLDSLLGKSGDVVHLSESGCYGKAYYNVVCKEAMS